MSISLQITESNIIFLAFLFSFLRDFSGSWHDSLDNITFSFFQGDVEDDETIPDNEQDIRPRFHKAKMHNIDQRQDSKEEDVCCF